MGDDVFGYHEFVTSLAGKLTDPGFSSDLDDFVTTKPDGYDPTAAADLVVERLGSRLRNAPAIDEIREVAGARLFDVSLIAPWVGR